MGGVQLEQGDITRASADAIVNAANSAMLGGGGVDGAIHRAAGPALLEACRSVEAVDGVRCPVGEARITIAGNLDANHVIHAVGPRYGIDPDPAALLASAYRSTYTLAQQHNCKSLAVPAISCGIYRYPLGEAAAIAMDSSCAAARDGLSITFYLFGQEIYDIFGNALRTRQP
ncbi:MAG: macro domain-containing protein [Halioglobus sp.]|nr:macro domain-containing protein [Halioglobus sp.]